MVNNWPDIIQNILFPPSCILCAHQGYNTMDLCEACLSDLPLNSICCPRCAQPLASPNQVSQLCGHCLSKPAPFDETFAPFLYQRGIRYLITGLKFDRQYKFARILGQLLAEQIKSRGNSPDCIMPVPLHTARYRQRGFNQCIEIANTLARELDLRVDLYSCTRIRNTTQQTRLPARQRRKNMRGAFTLSKPKPLDCRHIALLDDVMTTGTTVSEMAKTLKQAGAEKVDIWACARA